MEAFPTARPRSLITGLQMEKIEIGENGQVRVYYNPRRPEKSYLLLPSASGYIALLGVIFIPLVLYFMV
jgi:hypothetical protein